MKVTKELKRCNNGITLVALVITIIVLLILATVGIGVIAGEDGLIAKAKQSAEQYNEAAQEEAETVNELLNILGGENNPPQEGITAADINQNPSQYYGKEVIYTPQNGASVGWKIFYADEENIYLIADDYVENKYAPNVSNEVGVNKEGTYGIGFSEIVSNNAYTGTVDIQAEDERVTKWISHINSYTSTYENIQVTAYLLDTSIWSVFKDNNNANSKVEYVIGGPTLELFIESYNDIHETDINYEVTDKIGYSVKWYTQTSYSTHIEGLDSTESLYINDNTNNNTYGYWIGSPSARRVNSLCGVGYSGTVGSCDYDDNRYGIRPIICLKSSVQLIEQADGRYIIQ